MFYCIAYKTIYYIYAYYTTYNIVQIAKHIFDYLKNWNSKYECRPLHFSFLIIEKPLTVPSQ